MVRHRKIGHRALHRRHEVFVFRKLLVAIAELGGTIKGISRPAVGSEQFHFFTRQQRDRMDRIAQVTRVKRGYRVSSGKPSPAMPLECVADRGADTPGRRRILEHAKGLHRGQGIVVMSVRKVERPQADRKTGRVWPPFRRQVDGRKGILPHDIVRFGELAAIVGEVPA